MAATDLRAAAAPIVFEALSNPSSRADATAAAAAAARPGASSTAARCCCRDEAAGGGRVGGSPRASMPLSSSSSCNRRDRGAVSRRQGGWGRGDSDLPDQAELFEAGRDGLVQPGRAKLPLDLPQHTQPPRRVEAYSCSRGLHRAAVSAVGMPTSSSSLSSSASVPSPSSPSPART